MMRQSKALALLQSGKNVFLTGSAGAGKTYVLNRFIDYLKENKVSVAVTASTGIAATHMNGMTIHSWAGIGVKDSIGTKDLQNLKARKFIRDKLEKVQVLIIDEISMLHRQQLEMVNMVLKFFKKNELPFGGVQVVFCGDFFQLPPVGRAGEENRDKFAFMSAAWVEAAPIVCYINEQHRQSDNSLNKILNDIRDGSASQTTLDTLTSALKNNKKSDTVIPRLYTHNADVDRINQEHLLQLKTESKVFRAIVKGADRLLDLLKKSVLTDELLELRIGTKVMFIKNNYEKGYMNGTLGEIIEFTEEGFPLVKTANNNLIEAEPEDWHIEDEKGSSLASFSQVPLRLAWAITVHKSQGMTLDAAEVDLSRTFEKGQGYVALSRLKDIENLYLMGYNYKALLVDSLALKADKRFKELSSIADSSYSEEDLKKYAEAFLLSCKIASGKSDKKTKALNNNADKEAEHPFVKQKKKASHEITEELVIKGLNLKEIVKERGTTESAIIAHLKKIKELNPDFDLGRFKPDQSTMNAISMAIHDIGNSAYGEKGNILSTPIFRYLNEEFSFNEIKRALLFIDEKV